MKLITISLLFILFAVTGFSQKPVQPVNEYAAIDKKMLQLPDSLAITTDNIAAYISGNFKNAKEKARAAFIWTATKIKYDLPAMFAINFYESKEDRIAKALKTRMGICANYAAVFNDICTKAGMQSYIIEGFTRQNGFTDYIPHAWCATLIDTAWFVFDPTWGSGYVYNGKFISKINNSYFMASPAVIIKSHMPFDYLWQFLNYPVTSQEFYDGKIAQNKAKPYFNYRDSIRVYDKMEPTEQLTATAGRIERNGVKNSMQFDRLFHIKAQLENESQRAKVTAENERQKIMVDSYNASVVNSNAAANDLNAFIDYRNKQFTPEKPDSAIQAMLDAAANKIKIAKENLLKINNPDAHIASLITEHTKMINGLETHLKEQQDWLTLYFSKSKSKRKAMFYEKKTTLFGIPVN